MSSEIREKDHEWVCKFHSNFDRLLASFEKLFSQRRPPVYGDELLTDKEVSHLLKVSRRTLQDYRSNGILPYIQVGGKILYRASDIERTLMDGYREAYRSRNENPSRSFCLRPHEKRDTRRSVLLLPSSGCPLLFLSGVGLISYRWSLHLPLSVSGCQVLSGSIVCRPHSPALSPP